MYWQPPLPSLGTEHVDEASQVVPEQDSQFSLCETPGCTIIMSLAAQQKNVTSYRRSCFHGYTLHLFRTINIYIYIFVLSIQGTWHLWTQLDLRLIVKSLGPSPRQCLRHLWPLSLQQLERRVRSPSVPTPKPPTPPESLAKASSYQTPPKACKSVGPAPFTPSPPNHSN